MAGATILIIALALGSWLFSVRGAHALTDKDSIVLADFDNKTGDPVFDDTLRQGLSVELAQSPFLTLIPEGKVNETLKLMGRPVGDRLTPEVTREVCQRTSAKAMVTGSITELGSQYVIGLQATNCQTGDVLAAAQEQAAGKDSALKVLDAATVRLRSKLGESLSSVQKFATPLSEATTSSLEALKAYSLGRKTAYTKGDTAAIPFYDRAIELDPNFCDATLDKPLVTTDNNPGSPNYGTTYVYYTLFCNTPLSGFFPDGTATIPFSQSAILESHSPGPGLPFSKPALVSGALLNTQFSDMVIDAAGAPHIFFDDFTNIPTIHMWESTLVGGTWVVSANPVASFVYDGVRNVNWGFRNNGAAAPGCGIHQYTAYCAFSANQVTGGKIEGGPSVYLATINTTTGVASQIVRVNNDAFNAQKHHFFGWATVTPNGHVYVGWYDDRNDPFNIKVDYFVGKSTDGGKTFPTQQAVNDVSFNPCVGFPGCTFFGDYTQLVSGPDGVVHAAWSDTRDGVSMQIWSQAITF